MTSTEKNQGYRTADEMADRQREISVSEFFLKNRHLLGFDSGAKALVTTTVKEAVDNALDACEEAGILPELRVEVFDEEDGEFRVAVEDNGPGSRRPESWQAWKRHWNDSARSPLIWAATKRRVCSELTVSCSPARLCDARQCSYT